MGKKLEQVCHKKRMSLKKKKILSWKSILGHTTAQSSAHLNLKRLTLPSASNDVQQGEISCTAGRTTN